MAALSRGFVYIVATMGVTGRRETVAHTTAVVRAATSLPALIDFGISTPTQAARSPRHSDGAIVASALVAEVLEGASPADLESSVTSFRNTLDRPHAR